MSPYQRAAAVSTAAPSPAPTTTPPSRRRWPRLGDRLVQAFLQSAVVVVLAAMVVNWLTVQLTFFGTAPVVSADSVRTWQLDAVTLVGLAGLGIGHSTVRRGRPGRWPVAVLALLLPAVVVLAPGWASWG